MTRLLIIIVLALAFDATAAPITGKVTGEAVIELPNDPRIEALEKEVRELKAKVDKILKTKVIPADAVAVPLETLIQ